MCNVIKCRPTSRGVRLWIEGSKLASSGFQRGARYDRLVTSGCISFALKADGKLKVSGKTKAGVDHPIIDCSGKSFSGFTANDSVNVVYGIGVITLSVVHGEQS